MFSKFSEIVSSIATRLSAPNNSSLSYKSPGLPPLRGSPLGYTFSSSEKEANLRLSSSLQDLSPYRQLDLEDGDLSPGIKRNLSHGIPPNPLQKGNSGSSFSKEKASPGIPSRQKKCVRVICVLLCLLMFACLSVAMRFLYSNWFKGPSKFYVVIDCGSTGTRVYVYQASVKHNKDGNLPILLKSLPEDFHKKAGSKSWRAYNRMETEPGFDKLVHNMSGLREAIEPLVQWAKKQIPVKSHKNTSLFLYATAGLRRLPSSDSEWLLNNAWSILKSSPFLCKREWVKIITGMEEAYYGWIALNYHTCVLGAMPKKDTFGALDLGGSSLQVTFESKEGAHDKTSLKLSIGPVHHHLRAYSLSGYGLNDAFDRSVAHLLKRLPQVTNTDLVSGKVKIKHPCLQSGYKEQYMCSHCASVHREGESTIGGKEMGKGFRAAIQLIGTSKWEECSALAKVAVNLSEWSDLTPGIDCKLQPCALADDLPRPFGHFYAMSGFYVVYRFFNLTPDAPLDDVLEKGREFCEKSWDVAKISVPPQPFIEQYCFRAPYAVLLLREGLHIPDDHVIIGSGSITWTLGIALLEAGKAYPDSIEFHNSELFWEKINPVFLFAILFASLFVLVCALSCTGNWMPKFFRKPYLPLFRHISVTSTSVPAPFRFQRWSPTAEGRIKMPLSPTIASTQRRPLDNALGFSGSGLELTESSLYSSASSVAHSYSSDSLGKMLFDSSNMGSFWAPHRSQTRLQSRRSQSREDLNSSLAEAHLVKI
ncbi:putative apyrase 7 [Forsythia ovata]|uniref:Apyrase 7 n=1 Tax=Forsythia ovata TaxID=205694 RepID=A0ABD1WM42_9LAMI